MSETNDLKFTTFTGPAGLGGWLILPGLGLFLSIFRQIGDVIHLFGLFKQDSWNALTSPGSASYDSWWATLLVFKLAATVALVMFEILLLFLFRGQKRAVPQLMIAWLIFQAFVYVTVSLMSRQIPGAASGGIFTPIVPCLIWIPYFLTSKRVKETFIL